ncbi:MAG: tyrosine-type recombinase/integrase [bacterium]
MRLTKTAIDKAKPQDKPFILWDDEVSGFGVKVYESGKKSFVIDYRLHGRQRRMVVGRYGRTTLDEARKLAKQKLTDVLKGADPLEAKIETQRRTTVRDLCDLFMTEHSRPHKKSWREDERRFRDYVVPWFGKKRIADLKRSDVARLHNHIGVGRKKPSTREADNTIGLISVLYSFAGQRGFVPEGYNPAKGIKRFPIEPRDRWVRPAEWPGLLQAIEQEENVYISAAFLLLILLGVRKSELLRMKWDDIDFDRKILRLPQTKSGKTQFLPLSEAAIQIIQDLPRQKGNEFVLCGHRHGQHLTNISKPWKRITERAGLKDLRVHDLRRSLGSTMASDGVPMQVIQKVLRHANITTTQRVYGHLSDDPIRAAMDEHSEKVIAFTRLRKQAGEKVS